MTQPYLSAIVRWSARTVLLTYLSIFHLSGTSFAQVTSATGAANSGVFNIRGDQPQQVIKGLGFEIQSDSIGSGNAGMPDAVIAVPHDLIPSEKERFYKEMLHGFRYTRLAMGLYLRGTDAEQKHIIERYQGEMDDLRTMQRVSGIEGFDVEYWSPAPFWKKNKSFYGGTITSTDPVFLNQFSDALVEDLRYLQAHGLHISMWGLQNEPAVGAPRKAGDAKDSADKQSYATCFYSPQDYALALAVAAPKIHALLPRVQIQAPSWDGAVGKYGAEIRKDPALLEEVDAWTWHQVGQNSNDQIDLQAKYMADADGRPVYQNEFEYQPWGRTNVDAYFMNTGQALMNWMVFENSPTWFWLHALKPVTNLEATGYALGFWRPTGDLKQNLRPEIEAGHWQFNPRNWNALAGFLKYMPWDSTRLTVNEDVVRHDQRVLVWRKDGHIGIALSNRGPKEFSFHISGAGTRSLTGHRYTVNAIDRPLGRKAVSKEVIITVPPQSFEFWIGG